MAERAPLLLLTNRFPFGTGEEYLEHEIRQLVKRFERIIVIPCMRPNNANERELPDNVEVVRFQQPDHRRRFPVMVLRGIRGLETRVNSPLHLAYDSYFEGRSLAITDAAQRPLEQLLQGQVPAVVYSYWFYVTAKVGAELKRRLEWDAPLVTRAHGYDVNVNASPVRYLPQRPQLLEAYDRVHPVSDTATEYLRARYPSMANKVSTRRLGTPTPLLASSASRTPFMVVTCSMIRPLKRLHVVAQAVKLVRQRGHDIRWTHFGAGSGRYADRLYASVANSPHVHLRGYVPNARIFAEYRDLRPSVFVNASTSEGVPVSAMEAMASGIPVLATDVGGTRELLGPMADSALLPANLTADHLASSFEGLMRVTEETYASYTRAARQRWESVACGQALYSDFADELVALCQ